MEARLKGSLHRFQLHHPPIRSRRRGEIKEFSREIMRIIRRDARAQGSCLRFTWSLESFSAPPSWKNKRFTSWNGAVVAVCLRDASLKKKKKEKKNMQIERRRPVFLGSERGKETFGNR